MAIVTSVKTSQPTDLTNDLGLLHINTNNLYKQ